MDRLMVDKPEYYKLEMGFSSTWFCKQYLKPWGWCRSRCRSESFTRWRDLPLRLFRIVVDQQRFRLLLILQLLLQDLLEGRSALFRLEEARSWGRNRLICIGSFLLFFLWNLRGFLLGSVDLFEQIVGIDLSLFQQISDRNLFLRKTDVGGKKKAT